MSITMGLPPYQPENSWVAIDIELFTKKGDKNHLHRPHTGKFACMSVATSPDDVYVITDEHDVAEALQRVENSVWCFHNASFDVRHLRRWSDVLPRKKIWDTMIIDRILYGGLYDTFSLKDCARRHLSVYLEKETRETFEEATQLDQEKIEYCAMDASIDLQVAFAQRKAMKQDDFNVWALTDRPAMWAFLDFKGFPIDVSKWSALAELNAHRAASIQEELGFNPNSYKQVLKVLQDNGFTKLKSTGEDVLVSAIRKYPDADAVLIAQKVLDARKYKKRASTYGMSFLEEYIEQDDGVNVIVANYWVVGAETGRTASSNPNMQNIIARDTDEFRDCFISRPGGKVVIVDYSAQEPRLIAYTSQDEYLLNCFRKGKDPYISLAKDAFGETITKKDPKRPLYKDIVLGLGYGLNEYGLARKFGIDVDDAKQLMGKASGILRGVYEWGMKQEQNRTKVTTPFGRTVWINPYSEQSQRNARNAPIQGGAGDISKRALACIHQNWNFDYPFSVVEFSHDEIGADVPEHLAKEVGHFIKQCMEDVAEEMTGHTIPFTAELSIGNSWAAK